MCAETTVELLNILKNGQPVDEIAQVIAYRGATTGKYNQKLKIIIGFSQNSNHHIEYLTNDTNSANQEI